MEGTSEPRYLNIEYFFRLLYELRNGDVVFSTDALTGWWGNAWEVISAVAFMMTLMSLAILIYSTVRMRQLRQLEHHDYSTLDDATLETQVDHSRWKHVMSLIESAQENDWRQAIIEADIMLDDLLSQLGYAGDTVGDKLKAANPAKFSSLDVAWAAHRVRNDIAHKGSAYPLSNHLAYRTIKQYEQVFKEFNEI